MLITFSKYCKILSSLRCDYEGIFLNSVVFRQLVFSSCKNRKKFCKKKSKKADRAPPFFGSSHCLAFQGIIFFQLAMTIRRASCENELACYWSFSQAKGASLCIKISFHAHCIIRTTFFSRLYRKAISDASKGYAHTSRTRDSHSWLFSLLYIAPPNPE